MASLTVLVALAVVLSGCASSNTTPWKDGDAYVLRLRVDEGDRYTMEMTNDQDMTMDVRGQTMEMSQKQIMTYGYRIESVNDDTLTLEQTLQRVRGTVSGMMGTKSFDTDDSTKTSVLGERMSAMLNLPVSIRLRSNGEVLGMQGLQAMIDSLATVRARQEGIPVDTARSRIEMMLNPETFESNLETAYNFYPGEPVRIGDTWSEEYQMEFGIPMSFNGTYTLTEVEGTDATLKADFDVSSPDDAPPLTMGGVTMTMTMNGTMSGTMTVDLKTGLTKASSLNTDLDADAQGQVSGQTIDMTMKLLGTTSVDMTIPTE